MLYPTIYAHSNFGTWNCWNANLSNGFIYGVSYYIYCSNFAGILELGTGFYMERKFW